ncbi:MAG: DUF1987 domain-containing protein [Desulfobacterales bacterium]|nr:DUF1987 domain-containing protein [Desulfobacterales bacterium]
MEKLLREATEDTPNILFDCQNNLLEIKGTSYMDDPMEFYEPVFEWLKNYFSQPGSSDITVNIEIVYFHSGSTKVLLYFFDKLVEKTHKGTKITINWIYEKAERDMREYGEELQSNFKALLFNFVEVENQQI